MNYTAIGLLAFALVGTVYCVLQAARRWKQREDEHRRIMADLAFARMQRTNPHKWNELQGGRRVDTKRSVHLRVPDDASRDEHAALVASVLAANTYRNDGSASDSLAG